MNLVIPRSKWLLTVLILISTAIYSLLGYVIPRENFITLFSLYTVVFACFFILQKQTSDKNILLFTGIIFRLIFLFSLPHLSQDFYRFIWDGRLLQQGINPYNFLPADLISNPGFTLAQKDILFQGMGNLSATHFSNYPPANQFLFWVAALVGGSNLFGPVIFFKIIILLADIGTLLFGRKLLAMMGKPLHSIYLYFLNPLVILELSGNLHFEGVMVFFLIAGIYYFLKNKRIFASIFFALSIAIKLVPLILLPAFLRSGKFKKTIIFYTATAFLLIISFAAFYSPTLLSHYAETVSLWFINFEFNASIYYLIRAAGFYFTGYNIIHFTGIILPIVSFALILFIAIKNKTAEAEKLFKAMLFSLFIYFALSTTVHPWYIITLLALSVFTQYRFVLLWSVLIILSYSAYSVSTVKENPILLCVEYLPVYAFLFWELIQSKRSKTIPVSL